MSGAGILWSKADDARLAVLWAEGHSCAVLAREFGRSRNGIVGRVHRLHLPNRPSPIPGHIPALPKPTPSIMAVQPVIVAPAPPPPPPPPPAPSVRLCQYPHGDPGTKAFRFCEKAVAGAGPYCPTHHALCWAGRARIAA